MANFSVFRGDHAEAQIAVKDHLNVAANLTSCSAVLSLIDSEGNKTSIVGTIDAPMTGIVAFELTPTHTDVIGRYRYDVQITTALDKIHTVDSGTINIVSDISA